MAFNLNVLFGEKCLEFLRHDFLFIYLFSSPRKIFGQIFCEREPFLNEETRLGDGCMG
jgi:hypothetical protein